MPRDGEGLFRGARLASKTEWVFLKKTLPRITSVE